MVETRASMVSIVDSLRNAGVPMVRQAAVESLAEAWTFVKEVGYPLVLKGEVPGITHKTELGLVRAKIATPEGLEQAFGEMKDRVARLGGGKIVLQEQAATGAEFLLSARRVSQVGTLLTVGLGGTLVEVVSKIAVRLCPVTTTDIFDMFDELQLSTHIQRWRGVGVLDIDSFADTAISLGNWMTRDGTPWEEVELNPVIVHAAGSGCTVVDLVVQERRHV